jgi:hypothetical protein
VERRGLAPNEEGGETTDPRRGRKVAKARVVKISDKYLRGQREQRCKMPEIRKMFCANRERNLMERKQRFVRPIIFVRIIPSHLMAPQSVCHNAQLAGHAKTFVRGRDTKTHRGIPIIGHYSLYYKINILNPPQPIGSPAPSK